MQVKKKNQFSPVLLPLAKHATSTLALAAALARHGASKKPTLALKEDGLRSLNPDQADTVLEAVPAVLD